MKKLVLAFLMSLCLPMWAQTVVFDCGSTNGWSYQSSSPASNGCGVNASPYPTPSTNFVMISNSASTSTITSTGVQLVPPNGGHQGWGLDYGTAVSDTAFITHFTYVNNGFNILFGLENNTYPTSANYGAQFPWALQGGAGGEANWVQRAGGSNISPIQTWGIELDQYSPRTNGGSFDYSSAQMYQSEIDPSLPVTNGGSYLPSFPVNKLSTSPVPLNGSSGTAGSASSDTFDVTIVYTGKNVTLALYDITASGTCTPLTSTSCYTYTWQNVPIPSIVGQNQINSPYNSYGTAYAALNGGTSLGTGPQELVKTWTYSTLSVASNPTASVTGGSYGSTQSVTLSDSSSGAIICYNTTGNPSTDGFASCVNSTKYTGAISVSGSETLYFVAGGTNYADSALQSVTYTINATPAQPTYNPGGGIYQGYIYVYLTAPSGTSIYYNTTGSPNCSSTAYTGTPVTVNTNETLYTVGCISGTPGTVNSATYVVNPFSGSSAPNAADEPTASPVAGSYSTSQTVSLSSDTTSSSICYVKVAAGTLPTFLPQVDNGTAQTPPNGTNTNPVQCVYGTLYSGPITVSSSAVIYAMTGTLMTTLPSSISVLPYTITGGSTASTPTVSLTGGSYRYKPVVSLSTASPSAIICYNTTGSPATNGSSGCTTGTLYSGPITISSSQTLYFVAGGTSYTDSSVGNSAYTINFAPTQFNGPSTINKTTIH